MYCVWEVKDGISESEFQDFIDGPDGVNMGMKSLNNNIMKVNLELTGVVHLMRENLLNLPRLYSISE